jgi:hypothetical protein
MLEIVPRRFPRPRPHPRGFYPRYGGWGPPIYYDTPRYVDVEVVSTPAPDRAWRAVAILRSGEERIYYGSTANTALQLVPPNHKRVQLQRWGMGVWQNV